MNPNLRVVVTDHIEADLAWEEALLREHGIDFHVHQLKGRPEAEVREAVRDADVIVVNMVRFGATLIESLERCQAIIRHGIGYDNVDVDSCTRQGIQFAYQPDYCAIDVAEHAVALILACGRQLPRSRVVLEESSRRGDWDFSPLFPLRRMEGKTVGILGLGRIGSIVARKLGSFGFRLVGHDPRLSDDETRLRGVEPLAPEEVIAESDYLTLHTPLQENTRHLINERSLSMMKSTAYVINTARGGIVDAHALADAVRNGVIAGAAIDVFDVEPPKLDHPLFGLDRVILTPHIGWASEEAEWAIRQNIVNDILSIARGQDARCVVNSVRFQEVSRA